ncbi:unnamed protein product [Aphanomyces euteiches]
MKIAATIACLASALLAFSDAQQIGTQTPEVHPSLTTQKCSRSGCVSETSKVVADANYRWVHNVGGSTSCQNNGQWNSAICPDAATCAKNCAIEGYGYSSAGVTTSGGKLDVKLGNRLYLLEDDNNYKYYKLLNQEFTFDVDVSNVPCGGNAALYFVPMLQDGGRSKSPNNKAGAAYGTGYCDAQCPTGVSFINGQANFNNLGQCCAEMDIWEANKYANVVTPHPCTINGVYTCSNSQQCNSCDKGGCGVNPFTTNKNFYGPGSSYTVDTSKPFSVVTQFMTGDNTPNGNLVNINRFYVQNGKKISNPVQINEGYCSSGSSGSNGGLKAMGRALKDGMVLAISVWTGDMSWLDSGANGPCPASPPTVTSASYSMTNIRVGDLGTTTSAVTPPSPPSTQKPSTAPTTKPSTGPTTKPTSAPTTKPTSAPTTKPSSAPTTSKPSSGGGSAAAWAQCGGTGYTGPTTCVSGYTCKFSSQWYSQCVPN